MLLHYMYKKNIVCCIFHICMSFSTRYTDHPYLQCTWTTSMVGQQIGYQFGKEISISFLPLSHIAAQMLDFLMPLRFGAAVYFAQPDALKVTCLFFYEY